MSRSKRKTPMCGYTTATSDKKYKTQEHKRERRNTKLKIKAENYEHVPHPKKFGNPWGGMKDGKGWYGNLYYTSMKYFKELMRK